MTPQRVKCLIASTLLAILPSVAFAGASNGSGGQPAAGTVILNGQLNFGNAWSTLNTNINGSSGDVVIQNSGAGNVLDATTFDDTYVKSHQDAESPAIGSTTNADVSGVVGSVSIQGTAVCNSVDVSTDPSYTVVDSTQFCNSKDPSAEVNAYVHSIGGDVAVQSAAFGNNFSEDTNARIAPATINQMNLGAVYSTANTIIHDVGGSVAVTSSAIGNNAQIVHYPGNP